jgi:hypothetical protein
MIRARAGIGFTFVRTVDVEAGEVLVEFDGRDVTYGSLAAAKIAATRWRSPSAARRSDDRE